MRNSGLHSGPCSSVSKDREYAYSSSNLEPNPFLDEPPPYGIASHRNTQITSVTFNATDSVHVQGPMQATEGDAVITMPAQFATQPPVEVHRSHHVFGCDPILPINAPPYLSFNLTVVHILFLTIISICIWLIVWMLRLGFSRPSQ